MVLSLGSSLSIIAVGGFALNLTPWGLRATSWAVLLGGLAALAAALALLGRPTRPELTSMSARPRLDPAAVGLLGLALVMTVGAAAIALQAALQPRTTSFTQLWMLPEDQRVRVGLFNMESASTSYRVQLILNDTTLVAEWSGIELDRGQSWETSMAVPAVERPLEARLIRVDQPAVVYRRVSLAPLPGPEATPSADAGLGQP
jgi:uncharacterized membrane protein